MISWIVRLGYLCYGDLLLRIYEIWARGGLWRPFLKGQLCQYMWSFIHSEGGTVSALCSFFGGRGVGRIYISDEGNSIIIGDMGVKWPNNIEIMALIWMCILLTWGVAIWTLNTECVSVNAWIKDWAETPEIHNENKKYVTVKRLIRNYQANTNRFLQCFCSSLCNILKISSNVFLLNPFTLQSREVKLYTHTLSRWTTNYQTIRLGRHLSFSSRTQISTTMTVTHAFSLKWRLVR